MLASVKGVWGITFWGPPATPNDTPTFKVSNRIKLEDVGHSRSKAPWTTGIFGRYQTILDVKLVARGGLEPPTLRL
ncbi:MAG: hypothetical protein RIR04_1646 [Pseudomonadota bacterium]